MRIVPVILSGGAGVRLWPLSTPDRPKQFHALGSDNTLIQETALRFVGQPGFTAPVVICNAAHTALAAEQLAEVGAAPAAIVAEPFGRNTAAAAALAARIVADRFPGALALLLPADHRVARPGDLRAAVTRAAPLAADRIVTFGIQPTGPATGYGYIEAGGELAGGVRTVVRFVEKPNRATAEAYLAQGGFYWNAGMFLFAPEVMLAELSRFAPEVLAAVEAALGRDLAGEVLRLDREAFAACPSEAVDTAVMERTDLAAVAPCDIGWADIGAWSELWRLAQDPATGNAVSGEVALIDVERALVWSEQVKVSVIGLADVIVVATPDGVLVAPRDRDQEVKALLQQFELNASRGRA